MVRVPPDPSLLCDVYIDESSQTKHRYLTMGGLIVPTLRASEFDLAISAARGRELPAGEMAWTKGFPNQIAFLQEVVAAV